MSTVPHQQPETHAGTDEAEIQGSVLLGFAEACRHLRLVDHDELDELIGDIDPANWYPVGRLYKFEALVHLHYGETAAIFERAGREFITGWYRHLGGQERVRSGVGFLHFQSGSQGYRSVVRGDPAVIGTFDLVRLDERAGTADIASSTPFSSDFERGVIIGGMLAPGDLHYVRVSSPVHAKRYAIAFQPRGGDAAGEFGEREPEIPGPSEWRGLRHFAPDLVEEIYWRYQGLVEEQRRNEAFWEATHRSMERMAVRLQNLSRQLEDLAHRDPLTHLLNRRALLHLLEQEFARAVRYGSPLSVVIMDLDWFKGINDTYGHLEGDEVLRGIAGILSGALRTSDTPGRLGGEEFLLVFPGIRAGEALPVADKLRRRIAATVFSCGQSRVSITASFGVAERTRDTRQAADLLRCADVALYRAKRAGRNRVERFLP